MSLKLGPNKNTVDSGMSLLSLVLVYPGSLAYWMYFLPGCIRASFLHAKLTYFGDDEGLVYLIDVSFLFHGKQCSCQWEIFKHN